MPTRPAGRGRNPGDSGPALPDRHHHQSRKPGEVGPGACSAASGAEWLDGLPGQGPERGRRDRGTPGNSPNAVPIYRQSTIERRAEEVDRPRPDHPALDGLAMFGDRPLKRALSGLGLEYRSSRSIVATPADARPRSASTSARGRRTWGSAATSTSSSPCEPAVTVVLDVRDEDGRPTMASFIFRDAWAGFILRPAAGSHPTSSSTPRSTAKRRDGSPAAGKVSGRVHAAGPSTTSDRDDHGAQAKHPSRDLHAGAVDSPGRLNWFSGDHHVHAAGCAHYESPTEGVKPEDMMAAHTGRGPRRRLRSFVGPVLVRPEAVLRGQGPPAFHPRIPDALRRRGLGLSRRRTPATSACLRLKEDDYPGTTRIEEWPSWDLPVLQWGKSKGAVVGFSHSGWGLKTSDDTLPNYEIPPFDGIGANEYIVDVVHDAVDFISTRRYAGALGAEHLVSHAELRLPDPDQRRDRLSLHLRRASRPGPRLRQAGRRPARLRPLVRGDQGGPVVCQRRQEPPDRIPGRRRRRWATAAAKLKLAGPGNGEGEGRGGLSRPGTARAKRAIHRAAA